MLRHSMDEIPLYLTSNKTDAFEFANNAKPDSDQREQGIIGIDATTPINVAVYEFGSDGKLANFDIVKSFVE